MLMYTKQLRNTIHRETQPYWKFPEHLFNYSVRGSCKTVAAIIYQCNHPPATKYVISGTRKLKMKHDQAMIKNIGPGVAWWQKHYVSCGHPRGSLMWQFLETLNVVIVNEMQNFHTIPHNDNTNNVDSWNLRIYKSFLAINVSQRFHCNHQVWLLLVRWQKSTIYTTKVTCKNNIIFCSSNTT